MGKMIKRLSQGAAGDAARLWKEFHRRLYSRASCASWKTTLSTTNREFQRQTLHMNDMALGCIVNFRNSTSSWMRHQMLPSATSSQSNSRKLSMYWNKGQVIAKRCTQITYEQQGDHIAALYDLLHFKDKPLVDVARKSPLEAGDQARHTRRTVAART